MLMLIMHLSLQ